MDEDRPIRIGRLVDLFHKVCDELLELGQAVCRAVLERGREIDIVLGSRVLRHRDWTRLFLARTAEELPQPREAR